MHDRPIFPTGYTHDALVSEILRLHTTLDEHYAWIERVGKLAERFELAETDQTRIRYMHRLVAIVKRAAGAPPEHSHIAGPWL